jgi:isopentenyl diphosphate isomerase/L-lactate dehydrogenase-like FMN-dependent dehydrogenase
MWALAAAGATGVERLISLVREELTNIMLLSGRPRLTDLDATAVTLPGSGCPCGCRPGPGSGDISR